MDSGREWWMSRSISRTNSFWSLTQSCLHSWMKKEREEWRKCGWEIRNSSVDCLPLILIINLLKIIIIIKSFFIIYCRLELTINILSELVVNLLVGLIVLRQLMIGRKIKVKESKLGGFTEDGAHKFLDLGLRIGLVCQANFNNFYENEIEFWCGLNSK